MSANFAVSGSYDSVPLRFSSWYFAASTPGMIRHRDARHRCRWPGARGARCPATSRPARLSMRCSSASGVDLHRAAGSGSCHSCATRLTTMARSLRVGMPSFSRAVRCSSSCGTVDFVAEQHEGDRRLFVVLRNVLDHPDVHRDPLRIRVEVEQHVDAGRGRRPQVAQQVRAARRACVWARPMSTSARLQAVRARSTGTRTSCGRGPPGVPASVDQGEHALIPRATR